jgi:prevent-host-death family protein
MRAVGIRELKNRLSEYIRQVRAGDAVLVTDRGEVVAELVPPGHGTTDPAVSAGLLALARRNLVSIGTPGESDLYPRLRRSNRRRRTSAQLLDEERGGR